MQVAGGSEAPLDELCITGFGRANALCPSFHDAPAQASRPFDGGRCGFVMGEGAAVVVVEEREVRTMLVVELVLVLVLVVVVLV